MPADQPYRAGDEADFARLYEASYGRILGTLTGVLGDRATAEDCTQEAFVRAFRSWHRWKPEAPAEAWLHRIALNVALSHRRRSLVGQRVARLFHAPGQTADPAELPGRVDILEALRGLPFEQAAAVVLRHHHGYTNREIAVALGIPESTVASRLAAAKRKLAGELDLARVVTPEPSGVVVDETSIAPVPEG